MKNTNNKESSTGFDKSLVKIQVIGVGGGGINSIKDLCNTGIPGVDFMLANTDEQDLTKVTAKAKKIKLGKFNERGLGAGANPSVGKKAALDSEALIKKAVEGYDIAIVVAGMGGGTGTGAAPVIAKAAKEMGILTLGVVTTPFETEGELRAKNAVEGVKELKANIDSLITISNEKLNIKHGSKSLVDAFNIANEVIHKVIMTIGNLVNNLSLINIDFADMKRVLKGQGTAITGTATVSEGVNKAMKAAAIAVTDPILESTVENAKSAIVSVSGSSSITLEEVNEAVKTVQYLAGKKTNIIFGVTIDEELKDDVTVSVIATGITKMEPVKRKFTDKWWEKVNKKVSKLK